MSDEQAAVDIETIGEDVPLLEGIRTTRAIRRLHPDPVAPELIRKVVEAGTFAPSGGNRQPWIFVAVTDEERRRWIAERYRRAFESYIAPAVEAAKDPAYPQAKRRNMQSALDLARDFRTRFTLDPADDSDMVWSSDSQGLYFISDRERNPALYYKEMGSPEAPRKVFERDLPIRMWDIADDNRTIFFSEGGQGTAFDLWSADLEGETEPRLLFQSADHDVLAQLSPDEKWLSFGSRESGQWQVYVVPWPAMAPLTQVSTTTGTWSQWTKGGRELIFLDATGMLQAVTMTPEGDRMVVGSQETLFEVGAPVLEALYWSPTEDGERFLAVSSQIRAAPGHTNLVLDWPGILEGK